MYKVFIDNKLVIFDFDESIGSFTKSADAMTIIENFVKSKQVELRMTLKSKKAFAKVFSEYKYIEAAGGIVEREGKFLFIYRNEKWDIPKGKLDPGETVEEAAVREIEEECGLEKPRILFELDSTFHTYEWKGKHVLKRTYWFALNDDFPQEIVPQEEEGITDLAFLKVEEFDKVLKNTYASIASVIADFKNKLK